MNKVLTRRHALLGGAMLPVLAGCDDDEKPLLAGKRVDVLGTGAGLMVDPDDHMPIVLPPQTTVAEWPQPGRVPSHAGINMAWGGAMRREWTKSIGAGVSEPELLSYAALGNTGRGVLQATPIVAGGRIFVSDAQGVIRAFEWPRMREAWHFVPKPKKMKSSNLGGGFSVAGDTLYIVDGVAQTVAVDVATGRVKWRIDTGTPGRSAPTIADGRLFFGTIDERLFAVDAATGNVLWTYASTAVDTVIFGQPAPAVVGDVVVAGFGSGDLVALRAESGEVVWSDTLGSTNGQETTVDFSCVRGMPVVVDGTVYAISAASVLVALDVRSGRRLWERAVAGQDSLLVVDNWLYVLSLDQQLACIDRLSGHVRWITQLRRYRRVDVQKDGVTWTGPILAGGKLVCVSTLPETGYATIDPVTGALLSIGKLPGVATVAPIVVDGRLLIVTDDGHLIAYS
ncbi:Pyrrolo-quinoline quinone [Gluconacetobacter diazotrophicus PA1 5]|uniref:PQQ-binding-like beta-propeller repeat protein n=1 Tax=Gluconacetobacter diazotrophicus TaxID=33996 RepID=UPI000173B2AD|nr:PQQ-binding-like beta-propeller repeat protein [Gluconacetobacter diazotrophicus]ACI52835.1 Pyrrolo-quinoline quinone [Gluconacetobacter diazotrophicus PA1 5]TWB09020.1 outer membrane protein assembly factor BamB [Gluconacetobacter diazotrophicus]